MNKLRHSDNNGMFIDFLNTEVNLYGVGCSS
jgi:hypothetical protein